MTGERAAHYSRLKPYLGPIGRRWEAQRNLSQAARVVPAILEQLGPQAVAGEWVVQRRESTEARVAVLFLGRPGSAPETVLKVATTSEAKRSLSREAAVLGALVGDARLGRWRSLLPLVLAEGDLGESRYVLSRALAGRNAASLAHDPSSRARVQGAAAATIRTLHEQTGVVTLVTAERVEGWLGRSRELLHQAVARSGGERARRALERLGAEVAGALVERRLLIGSVHGDFWLGNLLVASDGATATGILDWDFAGEGEMPVIDLLHLLLYTRRLVEGGDLGGIVRDVLEGGAWSNDELSILRSASADLVGDAEYARAAVLLYWLRHIAANMAQSAAYARSRVWLRRNVAPVLELFDASSGLASRAGAGASVTSVRES